MFAIRPESLISRTFEIVARSSSLDSWQPLSVDEAVGILEGASFKWWICGGHALELHLGDQWREHHDLDVGICRAETAKVYARLAGWDLWLAAAGELSSWNGRPLTLAQHENNVWARRSAQEKWAMDLTVNECTEKRWIYRREPSVTRDWDAAVLETASGIPYLAPELQLLYKSKHPRTRDHSDASHVIPAIGEERRAWLSVRLNPHHPWQQIIGRSSRAVD